MPKRLNNGARSLQCRNRRRNDLSPVSKLFHEQFPLKRGVEVLCFLPSTHYPLNDFDLRATHARTLLPAALASVSFGFVLVRVRVRQIAQNPGSYFLCFLFYVFGLLPYKFTVQRHGDRAGINRNSYFFKNRKKHVLLYLLVF